MRRVCVTVHNDLDYISLESRPYNSAVSCLREKGCEFVTVCLNYTSAQKLDFGENNLLLDLERKCQQKCT